MMKFYTLASFIEYNEKLPCAVEGCNRLRYRKAKHCTLHNFRYSFSGDVHTKPVVPFLHYKQQVKLIKEVLTRNLTHEGLQLALKFVEGRLQRAAAGDDFEDARLWRGLSLYDCSPLDIIAQAGGIYLLWVNKSPLLKTEKHLRFMVGKSIMYLTNQARLKLLGAQFAFRRLGTLIDKEFAPLFISLAISANKMADARLNRRELLKAEFKVTKSLPPDLSLPELRSLE